jgi:hypothetical protein
MSYKIFVASVPDREKVVVEIRYDDAQLAELSNEHDLVDLELYPNPSGGVWRIDFDNFVEALEKAKVRLLKGT